MIKTRLGKTDLQVTSIGLGGAEIGYLRPERAHASRVLNSLLDEGVNVIDTAANYSASEEIIGESVGHRREQFVLISKCGSVLPDGTGKPWTEEVVAKTIDRSLKRLRTDVIDVMLLHTCDEETLRKGEALAAMVKAREAGKIRFVGYSGDNEAAAYAATFSDIAVIETSINIADHTNVDLLLPITRDQDIGVVAKRAMANAAWKQTREQPRLYRSYAATYHDRLIAMKLSPADMGISGPPEAAWPELAVRFTLSHPGVSTAIIGTLNPENALRNIRYAEKGKLPNDVVERICAAFTAAQGADKWTGQT